MDFVKGIIKRWWGALGRSLNYAWVTLIALGSDKIDSAVGVS